MPDLDRRRFLRHSLTAASLLVGGPIMLSSCATGPGPAGSAAGSAAGSPSGGPGGGTVRLAVLGSPGDTLDVTTATTALPFLIAYHVFDSLYLLSGGDIVPQLARTATPNADGTRWTISLEPAAVFSDGRPVTGADVLFSLGRLAAVPAFAAFYPDLDIAASRSIDDHTVELALTRPRGDLVEAALAQISIVVPAGTTDFTAPVGSGPFRVDSFSPDSGAVLVRNEKYWGEPALPDRLEIRSIADADARLAALTDGQLDVATDVTATGAQTLTGRADLQLLDAGPANSSAMLFYLNTRVPPFDDADVRAAVKLAVDRDQLVDVALLGYGTVGNDVVGAGLPGFADDLTARRQDQAAARAVLAAKGVTELGVLVGELTTGLTAASELLVQQLADVGVTLTVTSVDPATMFADLTPLHRTQILACFLVNRPVAASLPTYTGTQSPYSFSGWGTEDYQQLLATAQTSIDPQARAQALETAQHLLWAQGGDLLWGYKQNLHAAVAGLTGVAYSQSVPILTRARYA